MLEVGHVERSLEHLLLQNHFRQQHKFLVVGEPIEAGTAGDVRVLDASAFLAALPV
jgi:hypothetical protein